MKKYKLQIFISIFLLLSLNSYAEKISLEEVRETVEDMFTNYIFKDRPYDIKGDVEMESGMYKINFSADSREGTVFITSDGKSLIFSEAVINIAEFKERSNKEEEALKVVKIPMTDTPSVELYIMSLCPYGTKALNKILPVVEEFSDLIDFKVKYIVDVEGESINDVKSLHGIDEVKENLRQVAIMRYYPSKFGAYVTAISKKSCLLQCGEITLDDYWKQAAKDLDIDVSKVVYFVNSEQAMDTLRRDSEDSKKFKAQASPTMFINTIKSQSIYQEPAKIKESICSAFIIAPKQCQNLD